MDSTLMTPFFRAAGSVLAFAVLVLGLCTYAMAEDDTREPEPDAGRGKALAERLCVNCHIISKDSTASVPEGVPPFDVVANREGQTGDRIRAFLIDPHPPMPNMDLTRVEIDDIIAYLDTLREPGSAPLIDPKKKSDDPDYPDAT